MSAFTARPGVVGDLDYPGGISALDVHYVRPGLASSHLIVESGRAALVDAGTALSVPTLLAALTRRGLAYTDVDYVLLTHIHLDHAGGAGALVACLPNAQVVVHPRGRAHLENPAKLIAATKAVYGDEAFSALYGEILPIPASRLISATDGMRLYMANRAFDFWHTPGHALHHLVIHDRLTDSLFTGDTFGVSYRELDVDGRPFIFPTTSPSQFDPQQLKDSVRRIAALSPQAAYLTHYGRITGIAKLAEQLLTQIDQLVGFAHELATSPEPHKALNTAIFDWLNTALDRHGFPADAALRHHLLDSDVELNTQGLLSWLARQRNEAKLNQ